MTRTANARRVVVAADPAALENAVAALDRVGLDVTPTLGTIDQLGYFDVVPRGYFDFVPSSTQEQRAAIAERLGLEPKHVALLEGFAEGLSNAELADRLGQPVETVRSRVSRTLRILGVGSREEAVLAGLRHGVLDGGAR